MQFKKVFIIILAVVIVGSCSAGAVELNGKEIIERSDILNRVKDMESRMKMVIRHKSGKERIRALKSFSLKNEEGIEKSLIRFLSPADVRGTGFLSLDNPDGVNEKYLYLPALGRPRRLSSEERGGSFMGSDFSYEDISTTTEDYNHKLLRREEFRGEEVYVVVSIPKTEEIKDDVGFAKKISWISKQKMILLTSENRDKTGEVLKRLIVHQSEKVAEDAWMAVKLEMKDLKKGSSTVIEYEDIAVNTGVSESYFSIRYLSRPL